MPAISTYSLKPYKAKWAKDDLLHLLRRSLFGVSTKDLAFFKDKTLAQCLDALLTRSERPDAPLQEDPDISDPLVPRGTEWVDAPYENDLIDKKRADALRCWWVARMINRDFSLTEKMTLFWHNHFPVEMDIVKDARYSYQYIMLLRRHALGNFKKLIREGTVNPAMLVYLNGNSNNKTAPNENYSRELMELFTIGKASGVKYTEDDVKAVARVLTGWRDNKQTIKADFHSDLHDTGDKQFSGIFHHHVIRSRQGDDGAKETDDLIEMIFKTEETARFFCRNLYRWFVYAQIDEQTEQHIIEPLAKQLTAANFEIIPVLRTLLGSEHFFDPVFRGCIEKSPVDFLVGALQQFGVVFPDKPKDELLCSFIVHDFMSGLSMIVGNPPSVAGWPAYHQAPKYHQWWINPSSLSVRVQLINSLNSTTGMRCNGPYIRFDLFSFISGFENPGNVDMLVENCLELLYAVKLSEQTKNRLKAFLLPEKQSNQYWADAWHKYETNPNDKENKDMLQTKLSAFFKAITNVVQFQMI